MIYIYSHYSGVYSLRKSGRVIKDIIIKGIEIYNRYRSPEANVELIKFKENKFTVRFSGPFCFTCGFYDYFEDLVYELYELGLKTRVKNIIDEEENIFVEYEVES